MQRRAKLFWLILLVIPMSGCATPQSLLERVDATGPRWPDKPLPAKIEWVRTFSRPEDAGIRGGVWKQAVDLITGGSSRPISKPYGVLFDSAGRLFVADTGAGLIHLYDSGKQRATVIAGNEECPLHSPIGLAENEQGDIFITDSAAGRVCRYNPATGSLVSFAKQLERPTGIAFSRFNKLLYVSETMANRVTAFDAGGAARFRIEPKNAGVPLLNRPTDIAVDHTGQVFVTDPLNYRIRVFSSEGQPVGQMGSMGDRPGEFQKPKGIAVDADGHMFVVDTLMDTVQVFNADGQFLFNFGTRGTGNGEFWMPSGVSLYDDFIFVADTYNSRIQLFRKTGDFEVIDDAGETVRGK